MYKKETGQEQKTEKKILAYLRKHQEGTMILEIAKALEVHRHTIIKYIYRLEGSGKIRIRKVGIAKLCYLV